MQRTEYGLFRRVQGQTCIIKPLLQQWLEFAHVLKAQVQGLKARDSSLAEIISIQLPHGQANIPLLRGRQEKMFAQINNVTHSKESLKRSCLHAIRARIREYSQCL